MCAAQVSKPLSSFRGHFGRKGYQFLGTCLKYKHTYKGKEPINFVFFVCIQNATHLGDLKKQNKTKQNKTKQKKNPGPLRGYVTLYHTYISDPQSCLHTR